MFYHLFVWSFDKSLLTHWRQVQSILWLGSTGIACYSKNNCRGLELSVRWLLTLKQLAFLAPKQSHSQIPKSLMILQMTAVCKIPRQVFVNHQKEQHSRHHLEWFLMDKHKIEPIRRVFGPTTKASNHNSEIHLAGMEEWQYICFC